MQTNMRTNMSNQMQTVSPWYAQRWPWFLMLGPFLVVLAGSYTCWLAYTRQDALVVGDYYKQGQAINQDLRRDHAAAKLGLGIAMHYDAATGRLIGTIGSEIGNGISNENKAQLGSLQLHFAHSTQPEKDIKLLVQPDRSGAFTVALPMLEMARWQVQVENAQRDWRLSGIWSWPSQHEITIKADPAPID